MKIKIYHNPRWGKSRNSVRILNESNLDYEIIEYLKDPLSANQIKEILQILNVRAIDIIRTTENDYKENNLKSITSEQGLVNAIVKYPQILQRPIIINGKKGIIGRPPENIYSII